MASQAGAVTLGEAAVRQLVDSNQPPNPLAQLHLLADSEAGEEWRAAAHLLRSGQGPSESEVRELEVAGVGFGVAWGCSGFVRVSSL